MVGLGRFGGKQRIPWVGFIVMLALSLGCSAAGLVQRAVATPPPPTRELAPTFTPTAENILPQIIVTPPLGQTPGVIVIPPGMDPSSVIPQPTATPIPGTILTPGPGGEMPTSIPGQPVTPGQPLPLEPTATFEATPTPPPTPTATATPFVVVANGLVSLRSGPGVEYPLIAQLGPRIPIAIIGQNPEGTWYQICCVNGNPAWVTAAHVVVNNDPSGAPLNLGDPVPPPTPTPPFTETPTVTPTPTATILPFERRGDPQFFPTSNEFLSIWVKLYVGAPPNEDPADGYFLKVLFNDVERAATNTSGLPVSQGEFSTVGGPGSSFANLKFNLKYEYLPPDPKTIGSTETRAQLLGTGTWKMWIVDGAGNQLSEIIEFTTQPTHLNREVYMAWERIR